MENNTKTNNTTNNATNNTTKKKKSMATKFTKRGFLVFMLFVLAFGLLAASVKIGMYGVKFTEKNIVDTYGKLDTNTQLVLEETLQSKMKVEKIDIYFAFVYEDVNDQYLKEIGYNDNSVLVYYNDSTKKLSVKSDILTDTILPATLSSKEELADAVPAYLEDICNSSNAKTKNFYIECKTLALFGCLFAGLIILAFAILYLFYFIKDAKRYKRRKNYLSKFELDFEEEDLDK